MTLVRPTLAHKEQAIEMVAEFEEYGSPLNGDGFLSDFLRDSSYEASRTGTDLFWCTRK